MNYKEEYQRWCSDSIFDVGTKAELLSITDEKEIEDRFYKQLTFGTGGLRGLIGAGTNRMNIYTVGKATQGLADYINEQTISGSVVIAYDSRHMSREFALDSALILAANHIRVFLFDDIRPTPELSFAVRALHATAGIVITASHNPAQYNGYKVYWSDGGQIVFPHDKNIIEKINAVSGYDAVLRTSREKAVAAGLLHYIGKEIDEKYLTAIKQLVLNDDVVQKYARQIKIVYTPLHGTGSIPVQSILHDLGFEQVWVVPEQENPDGDFPTVRYPNPEDSQAFHMALSLAGRVDADVVLATDPDADRLGVYVKDEKNGGYHALTGNMSGALIAEYVLSQRQKKGLFSSDCKNHALITTNVSSKIAYKLAAWYGLSVIEVLTGFKYIGEQIDLFEQAIAKNGGIPDWSKSAYVFEFGFEESYGCLYGTYARDKDAVAAAMVLCEAAAYYRSQGISLWDQMQNLYHKYGFFAEGLECVSLNGLDGMKKMETMMQSFREKTPRVIGGKKVLAVRDYQTGKRFVRENDDEQKIVLPRSNVLYFELEDESWCCVRPSGTEPKIKFYFGAKGISIANALEILNRIKEDMLSF